MNILEFIIRNAVKDRDIKDNVKDSFLTQHSEYKNLETKCLELNGIIKKMRNDFRPNRDAKVYKDDIYKHILDFVYMEISRKK